MPGAGFEGMSGGVVQPISDTDLHDMVGGLTRASSLKLSGTAAQRRLEQMKRTHSCTTSSGPGPSPGKAKHDAELPTLNRETVWYPDAVELQDGNKLTVIDVHTKTKAGTEGRSTPLVDTPQQELGESDQENGESKSATLNERSAQRRKDFVESVRSARQGPTTKMDSAGCTQMRSWTAETYGAPSRSYDSRSGSKEMRHSASKTSLNSITSVDCALLDCPDCEMLARQRIRKQKKELAMLMLEEAKMRRLSKSVSQSSHHLHNIHRHHRRHDSRSGQYFSMSTGQTNSQGTESQGLRACRSDTCIFKHEPYHTSGYSSKVQSSSQCNNNSTSDSACKPQGDSNDANSSTLPGVDAPRSDESTDSWTFLYNEYAPQLKYHPHSHEMYPAATKPIHCRHCVQKDKSIGSRDKKSSGNHAPPCSPASTEKRTSSVYRSFDTTVGLARDGHSKTKHSRSRSERSQNSRTAHTQEVPNTLRQTKHSSVDVMHLTDSPLRPRASTGLSVGSQAMVARRDSFLNIPTSDVTNVRMMEPLKESPNADLDVVDINGQETPPFNPLAGAAFDMDHSDPAVEDSAVVSGNSDEPMSAVQTIDQPLEQLPSAGEMPALHDQGSKHSLKDSAYQSKEQSIELHGVGLRHNTALSLPFPRYPDTKRVHRNMSSR